MNDSTQPDPTPSPDAQYKPITQEEFEAKLKLHEEWLGLSEEEQQKQSDKRLVLKNYDLSLLPLIAKNLSNAVLAGCNFRGMQLLATDFTGADLTNANLQEADLSDASFINAELRGADLGKTFWDKANLTDSNLEGADVELANFLYATGKRVSQIKQAKNWDKAVYRDFFREKLGISDEACREIIERYVDWEMIGADKHQSHHPKYASVRDAFRQKKLEGWIQGCGLQK